MSVDAVTDVFTADWKDVLTARTAEKFSLLSFCRYIPVQAEVLRKKLNGIFVEPESPELAQIAIVMGNADSDNELLCER